MSVDFAGGGGIVDIVTATTGAGIAKIGATAAETGTSVGGIGIGTIDAIGADLIQYGSDVGGPVVSSPAL